MAILKDLLDIDLDDIMKMSADEARQLARDFGYKANARYTRLKKAGITTPATEGFERAGGRITTRGATRNELIADIFQARSFLTAQTSTKGGYNKFKMDADSRIRQSARELGIDLTDEPLSERMMKRLWRAYNKKELNEFIGSSFTSNQVQGVLYDLIQQSPDKRKISADDLAQSALDILPNDTDAGIYGRREKNYESYYDRIWRESK